MQRQRPWQQPILWQDTSKRKKARWVPVSILLAMLVVLLAVFLGVLFRTSPGQATHTPISTTLVSRATYQTPTYSAVKGMWLGTEESLWFQTLGEPVARQTMGNVVILTIPLTHVQSIGVFYLEERVRTHIIMAIDLIAPSVWNRQDGISLCNGSAGEEVRASRPVPLEHVCAGFSQALTVVGSPVQGSLSVFYFQGNPQAIKACSASLGSHISQTYTPPW